MNRKENSLIPNEMTLRVSSGEDFLCSYKLWPAGSRRMLRVMLHHRLYIYSPGCMKSSAQAKAWAAPLAMSLDTTIDGIPYPGGLRKLRGKFSTDIPIKTCLVAS